MITKISIIIVATLINIKNDNDDIESINLGRIESMAHMH